MVKRKAKTGRNKNMHGAGILKDLVSKVKGVLKHHKLVSRGLSALPGTHAKALGWLAGVHGYGRKKKRAV